jgi:RNA polymerase sigma factor (sigma-70 family)
MDELYINQLDEAFKPNHEPTEEGYFTEEDYQELQRNLVLYKEGSQEAVTYIIRMFHPFITKYARFIVNGDLPYSKYKDAKGAERCKVSSTISKFVSLFIDKKDDTGELNDKKKLFSITCTKIKTLFSKYEYGDIYNELVLALLNMANKYKITTEDDKYHKANGTFHMYVSKCFHWEAYRYLTKLINDPLSHFEVIRLCDQFDDIDDEEEAPEVCIEDEGAAFVFEQMIETVNRQSQIKNANTLTLNEPEPIEANDIDSLNFNWTNGVTCSELFKDLTPYEREIIVLSFIKNKTDIEIGTIYGCHRATINEHKKKAVNKIKQKAIELNFIK